MKYTGQATFLGTKSGNVGFDGPALPPLAVTFFSLPHLPRNLTPLDVFISKQTEFQLKFELYY